MQVKKKKILTSQFLFQIFQNMATTTKFLLRNILWKLHLQFRKYFLKNCNIKKKIKLQILDNFFLNNKEKMLRMELKTLKKNYKNKLSKIC